MVSCCSNALILTVTTLLSYSGCGPESVSRLAPGSGGLQPVQESASQSEVAHLYLRRAWTPSEQAFELTWLEIRDSRCPIGARCIRAGEVEVILEFKPLERPNEPTSLTLTLPGPAPDPDDPSSTKDRSTKIVEGWRIRLLEVLPRPRVDLPADSAEPVARISISRPAARQ